MSKHDEQILVVERKKLFHEETLTFQGIQTKEKEVSSILNVFSSDFEVMRRGDAEEDPTYKQPIPYVIVKRDNEVFLYKRLSNGGEARLYDQLSIGVGGHMNPLESIQSFDADENSVEGEEAGDEEEDEERELTPEEQAALEAEEAAREAAIENRAKELEEEVKKIGNNSPQIVELLTDSKNDEALQKSRFLLERLIESLLNENKPNYNEIGRYGKDLCRADRASSLGLYAQGLQAMNARKPDLKKAMEFFDKARKAKKPYRDAASAYTYCLINRFLWYAVSGLVILINIIVFVIWKIKKKKAAQALEKIEVTIYEVEMRMKMPFTTSFGTMQNKRFLVLEAKDESGVIGWGEGVAFEEPSYTEETLKTSIHMLEDFLIPKLLGVEIMHPDEVFELFRPIRRNNMAKSAIEGAVWDIYAQLRNESLAKAIGGKQPKIEVGMNMLRS